MSKTKKGVVLTTPKVEVPTPSKEEKRPQDKLPSKAERNSGFGVA